MSSTRLCMVVLILLLCVFTISCSKSPFGISGDTPLGKFEKYESFLTQQGINNNGAGKGDNRIGVGETYLFTENVLESEMGKAGSFDSNIVLTVDDSGSVLAVYAMTSGQARDKIRVVMKELWIKLTGSAPDFSDIIRPPTQHNQAVFGNKFADKGVEGKWEQVNIGLEYVKIALNDYAPQALQ